MNYIRKISQMSTIGGDRLIDLMDYYNVTNLMEISDKQAKAFYEKIINEDPFLKYFHTYTNNKFEDVSPVEIITANKTVRDKLKGVYWSVLSDQCKSYIVAHVVELNLKGDSYWNGYNNFNKTSWGIKYIKGLV